MSRNNKTKIPGRGVAKARLFLLLIVSICGALASFLTLPNYIEKLGPERAIPEAIGGCAVLFLLAAFFWGLLKWIVWMGKKSLAASRWFLEHCPCFTMIGFVIRLPIALLIVAVPPLLFGVLATPLYLLTLHFAQEGISFLAAVVLFTLSSILVLWMLFKDIRFLVTHKG